MNAEAKKPVEHVDVIIIGAGVSGLGTGCHLTMKSPKTSYAILEGRDAIGGTWDLFKYPGIRSDSDMYTFGFNFRPWRKSNPLAAGQDIVDYLSDTAKAYNVDSKIRFGHRISKARWSSQTKLWTLDITKSDSGEAFQMTCNFLSSCTGYYNYEKGYLPEFEGYANYKGTIAHPQHWPEDLDYSGKSVLIIGSGATAVTLVPAMAEEAAHVTMLQRSPTFIVSRPGIDPISAKLNRWLPAKLAYSLNRIKNISFGMYLYNLCRRKPEQMKNYFINEASQAIGPDFDAKKHLTPAYKPWDQRLCVVPDSDLFNAVRDGKASIVTDHIERFTEKGVKLTSGEELEADIIVPATGLALQFMGGIELFLDDKKVEGGDLINYKGMMYSNIPNLIATYGYTNASWTLKADLTADYTARLLNHMRKHSYDQVVPALEEGDMEVESSLALQSGYMQRGRDIMPKQGVERPWCNKQNYVSDLMAIKFAGFNDDVLKFSKASDRSDNKAA